MGNAIESMLADLGEHIDWPDDRDQVAGVRRRLNAAPARRPGRRWVAATTVVVIAVATVLLVSPQARQAVADLLGVAGIEITFDPDPVEVAGREMDLGEPVSLEEAQEAVDFELSIPEGLGPPDGVFLSDRPSSGRVSMVWEGTEILPAAGDTGIGLVYSQFAMDLGVAEHFVKSVTPDNLVRAVEVAGSVGLWIEGAPHLISYEDGTGIRHEEETRLSGNVLMWEQGGVTHRLETTIGRTATLALARSIQPVD